MSNTDYKVFQKVGGMDMDALSNFNFWNTIDNELKKERVTGDRRLSLYPSEAGVVYTDPKSGKKKIIGGCTRKSWYRLTGFPESNPSTLRSKYTMEIGVAIERMITNLAMKAGVYNNNSVKFYDKSSGVSGEIDIILEIPVQNTSGYIYTEVKSSSGGSVNSQGYETGMAKSLFYHPEGRGNAKVFIEPKPKEGHLLQILIYLFTNKDDPKLLGGKLVYFLRDNSSRTEFNVGIVYDEKVQKHRPVVNGQVELGFFVEDIYDRYKILVTKLKDDMKFLKDNPDKTLSDLTPPERDYDLYYTDDTAKALFESGDLSKSKYEKHQKGYKAGDWQCS